MKATRRSISSELLSTGIGFNDCSTRPGLLVVVVVFLVSFCNGLKIPGAKFLEIFNCFLLNHIQLVCATAMLLGQTAVEKARLR